MDGPASLASIPPPTALREARRTGSPERWRGCFAIALAAADDGSGPRWRRPCLPPLGAGEPAYPPWPHSACLPEGLAGGCAPSDPRRSPPPAAARRTPYGRSPEAGFRKGVERRFQAAENPFADQLAAGLFGIAAQGRDAAVAGGSHAVPAPDALPGTDHVGRPPCGGADVLRGSGGAPRPEVFVTQKHIWLHGSPTNVGPTWEPRPATGQRLAARPRGSDGGRPAGHDRALGAGKGRGRVDRSENAAAVRRAADRPTDGKAFPARSFFPRRSCSPSSEESNDGTHETKSALLRRRRMDSPPFVKGLTVVFSRQNGGSDFGSGVRASAQRRMRRCARTDRVAAPAEHDHREAPPRWFGPELNSDQAARCQEAVSIPGSVQVGPCARSDTVGHASSAPVAGPRPGRRVQGKRRTGVRLHETESGDRVRRGSAS